MGFWGEGVTIKKKTPNKGFLFFFRLLYLLGVAGIRIIVASGFLLPIFLVFFSFVLFASSHHQSTSVSRHKGARKDLSAIQVRMKGVLKGGIPQTSFRRGAPRFRVLIRNRRICGKVQMLD